MRTGKNISHLLGCHWLVDGDKGMQMLFASFLDILEGNVSEEKEGQTNCVYIVDPESNRESWVYDLRDEESIPEGSIAVIPIRGPIVKYGDWYFYGTNEYIRWIEDADANPNIRAIIFKVDSPGGMVDGTQSMALAIKKCQTPTWTWTHDGIMASAAYWIGSSVSNGVYASLNTDTIGSAGVYLTIADFKAYFKSLGLPIHEIYADQSEEKNKPYREALKKNYKPVKTQGLNPIAETFILAVEENRGSKLSIDDEFDWTKGGTRMANIAVDYGLIDGIVSFDELINIINEETLGYSVNNYPSINNKTSMKLTFDKVKKFVMEFFGISAEEASKTEVTAEHVDKLGSEVESQKATISEKEEKITQLEADNKTANEKAESQEGKIAELTEANEKLTGELSTANTAVSDKDNKITELTEKLTATEKERDDAKALAEEYGAKPNSEKKTAKKTTTDKPSKVESSESDDEFVDEGSAHMQFVKELDGKVN